MGLKDIFKKIKNSSFKNKFLEIIKEKRRFLFFVFFLLVLIYAGYLWYSSVYNYSWDENKKQEYLNSKSGKENFFNKNKFEKVISNIEKRKSQYQNPPETPRDIFGIE